MSKDPNKDLLATLIRWIVLGVLGFSLYQGFYLNDAKKHTAKALANAAAVAPVATDCGNDFHFPFTPDLLMWNSLLKINTQDIKQGSGEGAVCGQQAKLHYEYTDLQGKLLEKGDKETYLGEGKLLKGLELGMLGMKLAGERKIEIKPELAFYQDKTVASEVKNKPLIANVILDGLTPELPKSDMPMRFLVTKTGRGRQAFCGDNVTIKLAIWKLDGTKIFATEEKSLSFIMGSSAMPIGIEQAINELPENSEVTVIIPPAYTKPLLTDKPAVLPVTLPEHEVLVAHIQLLQATNETPKPEPKKE